MPLDEGHCWGHRDSPLSVAAGEVVLCWFINDGGKIEQWQIKEVGRPVGPGTDMMFKPGKKKYTFQVRVRKDRVTIAVNGRDSGVFWRAGEKVRPGWCCLRDSTLLGLMCFTDTTYHRAEVTEVSGRATFSRAR
jgi:hypothetical protein